MRSFATHVCTFAKRVRGHQLPGSSYSWRGGQSDAHQYLVKHFSRGMLFAATDQNTMSNAFDSWKLVELDQYLPDQKSHLEPFQQWSGAEAHRVFGVSPLLLSCWACLTNVAVQRLGDSPEAVLRLPREHLWKAIHEYEQQRAPEMDAEVDPEDPVFTPSPRLIAERAAAESKHFVCAWFCVWVSYSFLSLVRGSRECWFVYQYYLVAVRRSQ